MPIIRLKRSHFLICFSLVLLTPATVHAQQSVSEKIQLVEQNIYPTLQIADSVYKPASIIEKMHQLHINGVSVAVINNYKPEWAKGYGIADTANKTPVTAATLFLAGSISKSINALGVLKLADEKKIDLYADINQYLTSWKLPEDSFTAAKKITTANLLSHSAGLSVHGFPGYTRGDSIPGIQQILDGKRPANTSAVRSLLPPGVKALYSGGGITISQLIVRDVTGKPYETYMETAVLNPLGMRSSTFKQPYNPGKWQNYSSAYYEDGREVKGRFHVYPEMAAAGLWTNPTDLSRFVIYIQKAYKGKSNKVLSQPMVKRMLTAYIDSSAGLGVFFSKKDNKKFFSHGGADEGFRAHYFGSFESGYGAIVMVNSDNGEIIGEILHSISQVYKWPDLFEIEKRKTIKIPADTLHTFAGIYYFNDGDSASCQLVNNQLYIGLNNEKPSMVYFTSGHSFFSFAYPYDLSFQRNNKNEIELHVKADRLYVGRKKLKPL